MLINPEKMDFLFEFDEYSCYKERTNKCSLDEPFDENFEDDKDCIYHYRKRKACQSFYLAIKEDPATGIRTETIRITKHKCGHYTITGGQHRICIAQRRGLLLEVEPIETNSYVCGKCATKKSNYFKFRSLLRKITGVLQKMRWYTNSNFLI